jgi:antirestriction protein
MLRIFVNTWGNYNINGAEGGMWLQLPMPEDELLDCLDAISIMLGDDEFTIHDYEYTTELEFGRISEYDNIEKLNELCLMAEDLDEYDRKTVAAAVEAFGYDVAEAIERTTQGYFTMYHEQTLEDVAYELIEECYFTKDTPEIFTRYFNYEAFARDLVFDGYTETKYGVIVDA